MVTYYRQLELASSSADQGIEPACAQQRAGFKLPALETTSATAIPFQRHPSVPSLPTSLLTSTSTNPGLGPCRARTSTTGGAELHGLGLKALWKHSRKRLLQICI